VLDTIEARSQVRANAWACCTASPIAIDVQVSPGSQPRTATSVETARANASPKTSASSARRGSCRREMPSAAATAAPARRVPVRTTQILARSTSIVATSANAATTAPLAASDSAGIDEAKGMAAMMALTAIAARAIGHTISATRSSGP